MNPREMAHVIVDLNAPVRTRKDFDALKLALFEVHKHLGLPGDTTLSAHIPSIKLTMLQQLVINIGMQSHEFTAGSEAEALEKLEAVRPGAVVDLLNFEPLAELVHQGEALLGVASGLEQYVLEIGKALGAHPGFEAAVATSLKKRVDKLQAELQGEREARAAQVKELSDRVLELEGASILDKNAIRLQREAREEAEARVKVLEEQREGVQKMLADPEQQKVEDGAREQLAKLYTTERIVQLMKAGNKFTINSIENVTLGALVTLVKMRGCGAQIHGITTPEGWGWAMCIAVGSPGNVPALELAREYGARLQEMGVPKLEPLVDKHLPTYQELMEALQPFARVAAVYARFTPALSARNPHPVHRVENGTTSDSAAELRALDFENLHVVLTGKVPEGW